MRRELVGQDRTRLRIGQDVAARDVHFVGQSQGHGIAGHRFGQIAIHVHFFGTATLSFSAGVKTQQGDVFEIEADAFLFPLRNALGAAPAVPVAVNPL